MRAYHSGARWGDGCVTLGGCGGNGRVKRLFAWAIALAMGYLPTPIDAKAYIEQALNVAIQIGLATFGVSQAVHLKDLAARK